MIIDSIALKDFGIYGGTQEAKLSPTGNQKPIILFGGMNGGGKTTFLDAIQLVLYGPKARCSGRGKLPYREYLREMIHRGADENEGSSLELRFRRAVDGRLHTYTLSRSWRNTVKGIEERIHVNRDGEFDPLLSEHWDEYIESYIPSGIAHLFFFDAEQIKDLAEGSHAAEILGTAIHSLLGLELVDRLDGDLVAFARRKRAAGQSPSEKEASKRELDEAERLQQSLDQAKQEQGGLGNEIGRVAKELALCEEKFRHEGGELFLKQTELEAERSRFQQELLVEELALREMASGAAPFLLIPKLLAKVEKQAFREAEIQNSVVLVNALQQRDNEVLKLLKISKITGSSLSLVKKILDTDRASRANVKKEPTLLDANPQFPTAVRHLTRTLLPELQAKIELKLKAIGTLEESIARFDLQLARIPEQDAIAKLQQEVNELRQKHQQKLVEVSVNEEKIRVIARQLDESRRKLEKELNEEVDTQVDREHNARLLKHSARVRETLSKFRVSVVKLHAARLERLVLESFNHLLHKRALVTGLKIDPVTFRIELTGGDGNPLPFDRLSAGERQLLATSLLWGLAKASGRPLPTIIDTPLGRLDSSHRRHLLDRYFPVASHQVILLSTDEEVDEASFQRLKPHIGRSYSLSFDEKKSSTNIKPGYFWQNESTH